MREREGGRERESMCGGGCPFASCVRCCCHHAFIFYLLLIVVLLLGWVFFFFVFFFEVVIIVILFCFCFGLFIYICS